MSYIFIWSRAKGRWKVYLPEESPGSTGQGAGVKPGRGDPTERTTEKKPPPKRW